MTIKEAILKSLEDIKTITNYNDVCNHIIRSGYYDFKDAKTPHATVSALLGDFIRKGDARVKRIKNSDGSFSPELYRLTPQEAADSRAQISAKDELGWNPEDPGQDRCESYQSSWDVEPW